MDKKTWTEFCCTWSLLGKATISNDGATIISLLNVVHPAAKTLVDISKSQDAEVCKIVSCEKKYITLNKFDYNHQQCDRYL